MWRRPLLSLAVVGLLSAVAYLASPGVRYRLDLLAGQFAADSARPWSEVAVELLPYRWQAWGRGLAGETAEAWAANLPPPAEVLALTPARLRLFDGPTPNVNQLDCHYSVLRAGEMPHPPHVHSDEEIILPIVSAVDILRADRAEGAETRAERLEPGQLVYHSPDLPHTIRAVGPEPATYLVLRWASPERPAPTDPLPGRSFDFREVLAGLAPNGSGRARKIVLEGQTRSLERLHAHLSVAAPGTGSEPHTDPHDVALVLFEGALETDLGRFDAPAVVFHPRGRVHFLRSAGERPARYLAIELVERN